MPSRIVEQKMFFCLHAQLRLSNFLVHSCEKESSLWLCGLVGYNLVKIKARHLRCCKQYLTLSDHLLYQADSQKRSYPFRKESHFFNARKYSINDLSLYQKQWFVDIYGYHLPHRHLTSFLLSLMLL